MTRLTLPTAHTATGTINMDGEHDDVDALGSTMPPSHVHPASPGSRSRASPLLSTLSRLSLAPSRPDLPPPPSLSSRLRSISALPSSLLSTTSTFAASETSSPPPSSSSSLPFRTTADLTPVLYPALQSFPSTDWPVLVLSLAHARRLDSITATDDELFDGVMRRIEPWVAAEGEGGYVLVVLAGGAAEGDTARRMPGVAWWLWKYRRIPRRKNMKKLFIVHPSSLTKTVMPILLPVLSPKSYAKLHIVPSLVALSAFLPLRGIDIDGPVLVEEGRALRLAGYDPSHGRSWRPISTPTDEPSGVTFGPRWAFATLSSAVSSASSYFRDDSDADGPAGEDLESSGGHSLHHLAPAGQPNGLLYELVRVVLTECTREEGIFRRSCTPTYLSPVLAIFALPQERQPALPLAELATLDPLLPPVIIKRLLSGLHEPLIGAELYPAIRRVADIDDVRALADRMDTPARAIVSHVVHLAHHLLAYEAATKMTARAFAVVLAPTLIKSGDPLADAQMCLEQGKTLPPALRAMFSSPKPLDPDGQAEEPSAKPPLKRERESEPEGQNTLVGVLELWIERYGAVQGGQGACTCDWHTGAVAPAVKAHVKQASGGRHELLGTPTKRASLTNAVDVSIDA